MNAQPDADPNARYDVTLLNIGNNLTEVTKILRTYTTVGLREAKILTEDLPKLVCQSVDQKHARELAEALAAHDAGVSIRKV